LWIRVERCVSDDQTGGHIAVRIMWPCYRQHCAQRKAPVFKLLRGPPPRSISPHPCNDKDIGPPKLTFLLRFDQNVEYKRPTGVYPLRDFHKICTVCTSFQEALAVKISLDVLNGLWTCGGFKSTVSSYPQIFSAPSGETVLQNPKKFRGARTCLRSSITLPSFMGLGFHPPQGRPKTLSFFSVGLFVRHAFERERLYARFHHEDVGAQKRF